MLRAIVLVLVIVGVWIPGRSEAGLQDQLDAVFGDLTNATSPLLYKGQRRGAIVGGSFYARSRIMESNLINLTPPGFRAGCGGIDFFGGSFSFINASQFIQLLRAIGQNAAGYAFYLAFNGICPACVQVVESLQKKIQWLNQNFSNSCKMAKFLVDKTIGGPLESMNERVSSILSFKGLASDTYEAHTDDPVKTISTAHPPEEKKLVKGNLAWRALKKNNAEGWFQTGGDTTLLETIMSLTGSVIISDAKDQGGDQGYAYPVKFLGRTITLSDLLRGGEVTIWKCDTTDEDGCLNPSQRQITLEGLDTKTWKLMDKIVEAFNNNVGFGGDVQKFMENSMGVGAMIRNLHRHDPMIASLFAEKAAPVIASEMVFVIARDMVRAIQTGMANVNHTHSSELVRKIDRAWSEIVAEHQAIVSKRGNFNDIIQFYVSLIKASQPSIYAYLEEAR